MQQQPPQQPQRFWMLIWRWILPLIGLVAIAVFLFNFCQVPSGRADVPYSFFKQQVQDGNVSSVTLRGDTVEGRFTSQVKVPGAQDNEQATQFVTHVPAIGDNSLLPLLQSKNVTVNVESSGAGFSWGSILWLVLPFLLIVGLFWMMRGGVGGLQGSQQILDQVTRSRARRYREGSKRVTFADVAGEDEAKQDLMQVVEFLKDPDRFRALGAKIPKGILLVGSPGTGKTLLAKAVAGEANAAFFSISGSEFTEVFVGVGAARVRDLFKQAREAQPSIVFIDEIDAVGRQRGAGFGGGNDEREQTLNQILAEMDGFEPRDAVIVLAATNRPDVLDPALLRPGRFDRRVEVGLPDRAGREAILKVHVKGVPLAGDVDLAAIARSTPGFAGADLANLVNEAAILAAQENKKKVSADDFARARERIILGLPRRLVLSEDQQRVAAYHESGHALVGHLLPNADPVEVVTIVPHSRSLGVTQQMPDEDRYNYSKPMLDDRLAAMLGGRAAEELIVGTPSTGAENDLKEATKLARRMVANWGMSDRVGPIAFESGSEHPFLGREIQQSREYSEETAAMIDEEVRRIVEEAQQRATQVLREHEEKLHALATALREEETLSRAQIEQILGKKPSPVKEPEPKIEGASIDRPSDQPVPGVAPAPTPAMTNAKYGDLTPEGNSTAPAGDA